MITEILNYTIVSKIGEGSMGRVFLGKNKSINQYVAIKMLNPRFSTNPVLRNRFRQEAIMLSSLSHPNIVKFLNYVENEYGVFLIMEYVEGMNLEDYLNKKTGLLIEEKAFPMMLQILDAFAYAHDRNLVHRDIKPSNIFVTNEGDIKILDFGIAQILSETEERNDIYSGTLEYMSPEQIKGQPVDVRSDIYSLGVVFYQMLTGKAPYDVASMSQLDIKREVVNQPLKRMNTIYPYVSDEAQRFVDHAMCKNPDGRFANCHQMIEEIERIQDNNASGGRGSDDTGDNTDLINRNGTVVEDPDFLKEKKNKNSKIIWIAAAIAVAIITAGGILGYLYYANNSEKTYADYVEKWGIAEGINTNVAISPTSDHYKIKLSGGKPMRLTYVDASGLPTVVGDSLLSKYKHTDTEFIYSSGGKLEYKNIYDQNGNLAYKVTFNEDPNEATAQLGDDSSGNTYKLNYDPATGRLATLYYLDKKGEKRAERGVYGEKFNYDGHGRLSRVTYLDKNYNPSQDETGVGIISFDYKESLSDAVSTLYDKTGKPAMMKSSSGNHQSSHGRKHRGEKTDKSTDNKAEKKPRQNERTFKGGTQHDYLKDRMRN